MIFKSTHAFARRVDFIFEVIPFDLMVGERSRTTLFTKLYPNQVKLVVPFTRHDTLFI